ncbi:MAG TPA: glycogen synthase [Mycobacteriales bacterium]|nr:glycogen synthase [Mycobacteriales bacterium]
MTGYPGAAPRVGVLTREYPPEIYGGAGVHVEHLVASLRALDLRVDVHCFGANRPDAAAYLPPAELAAANPALGTLGADLEMAAAVGDCDIVHSHTWYANMAGHLACLLYGTPHVVTAHSLEPQRPWKAEQLGGGYRISSWAERTAYNSASAIIAVSEGMRADVLAHYPQVDPERVHVVYNGIDSNIYRPVTSAAALERYGVDPDRPYVLFVGRITRQKGLIHLVRAAHALAPEAQLVLCAGAPDTPEIAAEMTAAVAELQAARRGVLWIREMVPRPAVVELLSHARVFCCPSTYEPLGIVNLEAMACGIPVVATRVGGIPEVVQDGVTGTLVTLDGAVEEGLADALNALLADPALAGRMGEAGRKRALSDFSWTEVARQTAEIYNSLR